MSRWYWLNPDKSISLGPRVNDPAFKNYSDWLYGLDINGVPNKWIEQTTTASGHRVSTVFLGLDHGHGGSIPVLFETLVFPPDGSMNEVNGQRYTSYEVALLGHREFVENYGGPVQQESPTAQGARDYEEIMSAQATLGLEQNKA